MDASPKPVSIREVFATSVNGVNSEGTRYNLQPGSAATVDLNGEALLAIPIVADASNGYTLTVQSHVVRLSRDKYVLYYPVISLISADYQVQQTLKPRNVSIHHSLQALEPAPAGTSRDCGNSSIGGPFAAQRPTFCVGRCGPRQQSRSSRHVPQGAHRRLRSMSANRP